MNALFISSIDPEHLALVQKVEAWAQDAGIPLTLVDGYRNGRMMEKLGIGEMPALVTLAKGVETGRCVSGDLEEIRRFLG